MSSPLLCKWTGEALEPHGYFRKIAAAQFKLGETYRIVEVESRSWNSHRHFFACINEAWRNLSENDTDHFPSPDHLRKWALTYTPFCTVREFHATTFAEAVRVARYLTRSENYKRVQIDELIVREFTPLSQALSAMPNNRTFQKSKSAVLDVLARRLGISVEELEDAGRRAA